MKHYSGKSVYPGIAFGPVFVYKKNLHVIDDTPAEDVHLEWERFESAKRLADAELERLFQKAINEVGKNEAEIIDVERMILEDGDFVDMVKTQILDLSYSAAYAVSKAGSHFSQMFAALDDPYMNARAPDISDAAQRVIQHLTDRQDNLTLGEPSIIIADDLSPSETLQLDRSMVRALILRHGSANSHTAILARTLRIPTLIQADIPLSANFNSLPAAVDAHNGIIYLEPDEDVIRKLDLSCENDKREKERLQSFFGLPTVTLDGQEISLFSNINGPQDLELVLENDAEGIGVYRSEFLFLAKDDFPGEDEQFEAYRAVADGMKGRPVTIRTLDIGADKNIRYFGLTPEENPALGLRAVRIYFERPDVFKTQLRAIYRASAFGNVSAMFPMISSLWELKRCKEAAAQVREELALEGIAHVNIPLGIMVETPAAALIADELALEADFFSVGTNDLIQYTLAADRQNEKLEPFFDKYHPAVLKLLKMIVESASRAGIEAGVCGELAADPDFIEIIIQMGYMRLSVSPGFVLKTREKIRGLNAGRKR